MNLFKDKKIIFVFLGIVLFLTIIAYNGKKTVDNFISTNKENQIIKNREHLDTVLIPMTKKITEAEEDKEYYDLLEEGKDKEAALVTLNTTFEELKRFVEDYNKLARNMDNETFTDGYEKQYDYKEIYNEIMGFE